MILQTGMHMDIPAFFSKWFVNRLTEGFVLVRSPYNPQLVTKHIISLSIFRQRFCGTFRKLRALR
ncbi:DUF1848 family protein [Hallerella succinigenes]|uniref:DUF1848 family protein n=1 Tax=Hallerella succinigenes TaxID=1896222 RepID=UPI000C24AD7F|nr:DUF1848 family protein [Hallerella succinigenes]